MHMIATTLMISSTTTSIISGDTVSCIAKSANNAKLVTQNPTYLEMSCLQTDIS